jgi:hypothetical protein
MNVPPKLQSISSVVETRRVGAWSQFLETFLQRIPVVCCHVATIGVFFAIEAVFNKYEQPYQNSE